jgi:hypothetical protein
MERIDVVLNGIKRTGGHFVFKATSSHRVVSETEFKAARSHNFCILRSSALINRQLLWTRTSGPENWLSGLEILYLDTSRLIFEWKRHGSRRDFIKLPDPAENSRTTYAFVFTPPHTDQDSESTLDDGEWLSKALVRVDIGVQMRCNANISIHSFWKRKDLDYPKLSHIPHMRFADIPRSHLESRLLLFPLRSLRR